LFSCFAVDFILKKLSIFASCFIVNGARPIGLPKYYHQSELSVLITSQLKIKLIPEQKVRRFEGRLLQRAPYSKRALLEENVIYVTSVFKTCKAEWLQKIIFTREYRIPKETLALGNNSSQDPRFLLTLAAPLKMDLCTNPEVHPSH